MKISAIEIMDANSKKNLKLRNDQPVPVEQPTMTGNSDNVMKALTLKGQNNVAFGFGGNVATKIISGSKKVIPAALAMLGVASCEPFSVTQTVTVDFKFMESILNALMSSNNMQKEELELLKIWYQQAQADSEAAQKFYKFAYEYMKADSDIQQKIYNVLIAQGYSNEEIIKYLASIDAKLESGEMTFEEAMKIIQGLLSEISEKIDLTFLEKLYNQVVELTGLSKTQIAELQKLYELAQNDSKAAEQFYKMAYTYMMNDTFTQQQIYNSLKAQGYTEYQIMKYIGDIDKKLENGEITFEQAMKIIQDLLGDINNKLDFLSKIYEHVVNIEGLSQTQITELQKLYELAQNDSKAAEQFYKMAYTYMMNDTFTQQQIYNSLKVQGYTDYKIMQYLADIDKKLESGEITFEEAMKIIQGLLGDINNKLDEIKDAINQFRDEYKANEKESAKQRDTQIKLLQGIWSNGTISNYQQAQLIYGQGVLIDAVNKQNKSLNDIKNQILKLNINMNADFKGLAVQLGMSTAELMNVINDLGITIKNSTGKVINAMDANTGDIIDAIDNNTAYLNMANMYLAKITRYSSLLPVLVNMNIITNAELNNISRAINNLEINVDVELTPEMFEQLEEICNKLDAILGDIQGLRKDMNTNQTAIYNAILDGNKDTEKLAKLIEENNKKSDMMISQNDIIIKLLESLDKKTATIEEIAMATGMDVADIKAFLKDLKIDVSVDDIDLSEVIDAINNSTGAINANTEYLKQLNALTTAGFDDIKDILKNIDKQTKTNGDILASEDSKLALISTSLSAFRSEVAKYDEDSLAKLDEILKAIKNKKCDCKGSEIVAKLEIIIEKINNHEGVIEDMDDLFG